MAIQLKSGLILLDGGQIANDAACCCGINLTNCTCAGANAITVNVVDNFGYSINTSGNYAAPFVPSAYGCAFEARTPLWDSTTPPAFAWRVLAPVVFSFGALVRVALDWVANEGVFAGSRILVPYAGGVGPWRFNHPGGGGRYIDVQLVC
jgi:hypothetical protein